MVDYGRWSAAADAAVERGVDPFTAVALTDPRNEELAPSLQAALQLRD